MVIETIRQLNPTSPAVTETRTSQALKTMNFIVGLALLVMLFPIGGKLPEKPAGVRTAIELIDKRGAKSTTLNVECALAIQFGEPV